MVGLLLQGALAQQVVIRIPIDEILRNCKNQERALDFQETIEKLVFLDDLSESFGISTGAFHAQSKLRVLDKTMEFPDNTQKCMMSPLLQITSLSQLSLLLPPCLRLGIPSVHFYGVLQP